MPRPETALVFVLKEGGPLHGSNWRSKVGLPATKHSGVASSPRDVERAISLLLDENFGIRTRRRRALPSGPAPRAPHCAARRSDAAGVQAPADHARAQRGSLPALCTSSDPHLSEQAGDVLGGRPAIGPHSRGPDSGQS